MKTISEMWENFYIHLSSVAPEDFKTDSVMKNTITNVGNVYRNEMSSPKYNYFKSLILTYLEDDDWYGIDNIKWKYLYYTYHVLRLTSKLDKLKVLEIGPGFGGLAKILYDFNKVETYFVVEHPIMMKFFRYFNKFNEIYHVLPEEINYLESLNFDILIATLCLTEVPKEFRVKILSLLKNCNSCLIINTDDPPGVVEQIGDMVKQAGMKLTISPYLRYGAKIIEGYK